MSRPQVVSQPEWSAAIEQLRDKEKQATRVRDALAAERPLRNRGRTTPMAPRRQH